jgi:hypothetical protein
MTTTTTVTTAPITRTLAILALLAACLLGTASGCKTRTTYVPVAASVAEYEGDMLDLTLPDETRIAQERSPCLVKVRTTSVDWDAVGDVSLTTLQVIGVACWYSLEIIAHCCAAVCK